MSYGKGGASLPDELLTGVGDRVRTAREAQGLSQRELAARLGLKREAITRLEAGQNATVIFLARVAIELGVELSTFFEGLKLDKSLGQRLAAQSKPRGRPREQTGSFHGS